MIFKKKNTARLSDEELMLALASGNQEAFSVLYQRFNERLFYFFYRMLGNDRELANDFLQDIFLKIINKPELFKPDYKFTSWIFSIAHNMCKNEYRKRNVRQHIQNEAFPDQYCDESFTKPNTKKEQLISVVYSELENLDENQRSILILKYKENLSIQEISEILGLPVGTIKSRLHYARIALSKRVAKKEQLN